MKPKLLNEAPLRALRRLFLLLRSFLRRLLRGRLLRRFLFCSHSFLLVSEVPHCCFVSFQQSTTNHAIIVIHVHSSLFVQFTLQACNIFQTQRGKTWIARCTDHLQGVAPDRTMRIIFLRCREHDRRYCAFEFLMNGKSFSSATHRNRSRAIDCSLRLTIGSPHVAQLMRDPAADARRIGWKPV